MIPPPFSVMNRKFNHLRAVFCLCCRQQRILTLHRTSFTQRCLSGKVVQTFYLSGTLGYQTLRTKFLSVGLNYHHSTGHSFSRPLSAEAASDGQDGQWKDRKSKELSQQSYSDSSDDVREKKLDQKVRQSYSSSKRYTSREVEADEEEELIEDEADRFGTLSNTDFFKESDTSMSSVDLEVIEDERDWKRERQRRNTPYWYATRMKELVKKGKLAEAIDFLEDRMLKLDHVQPIEYNYNVLIGACGRAGYTKKAFQLYNRMKERGLHPSNVTYTSLFNACAESPWPIADGYERLKKLHQQLTEKDVKVNLITTHAMIKAYGKCGDIEGAFHLFHHLLSSGYVITRSFASVLIACASNKEAGFTYAIEAWRQMLARGLQPDEYCFNLLLRIVRDCGTGDPEMAGKILLKPVVINDAQLLGAGRGKKGKGRGRGKSGEMKGLGVSKNKDGGGKNIDEMIQLPAALIKDVNEIGSPKDPDWQRPEQIRKGEDFGDDLRHGTNIQEMIHSPPTKDVGDRNNLPKGHDWHGTEQDSDRQQEDFMDNSGHSGKLSESKHWWQELDSDEENGTLTVQEELHPLDHKWRTGGTVLPLPNLLDQDANFENVESLASIQTPSDRLSLIGGVEGVLQQMKEHGVKPNVKTLSMFTDVVPRRTKDENRLLALVGELGVSVDVDFYNMIILRRSKRGNLAKAKEIVAIMHQSGLQPNLRTFANLAIQCQSVKDGLQLLKEIESYDMKPNIVVYGALMNAACRARSYGYLVRLLQHMKENGVRPNKRIIELLEDASAFNVKENTGTKPKPNLQDKVNRFRGFYYKWLAETEAAEEPHPWDAYTTKEKKDNNEEKTTS